MGLNPSNNEVNKKVAIIILNWNCWKDTLECLESVQRLNYPSYEIIVLDNGSTDRSVEKIIERCKGRIPVNTDSVKFSPELKPVRFTILDRFNVEKGDRPVQGSNIIQVPDNQNLIIIQSSENLGFAEGNNVAIKSAFNSSNPPEFVFLLNNDTWVDPNCLSHLIETAFKEKASIVGSLVKDQSGKKTIFSVDPRRPEFFYRKMRHYPHDLMNDEPTTMVCGCAMLIHRSALMDHENHYGYFLNTKLFLYGEETEFCLNAKRLGHNIFVSKKSLVYHKDKSNSRENHRNLLTLYYMTRNAIHIANNVLSGFWLIFFHIVYPFARLKVIIRMLVEGKIKEASAIYEGIRDGYKGIHGKWRKQR